MLKHLLTAGAMMAVFGAGLASADTADGPLKIDLQAQAVTLSEEGTELFAPAEAVLPGSVIEYRLTYENVSEDALDGFIVNGKIPEVTVFIADTAKTAAEATLEARVEDIGWSELPVTRYLPDETGILRAVTVPPEEYAALRWRLADPLAPGASIETRYRVAVND